MALLLLEIIRDLDKAGLKNRPQLDKKWRSIQPWHDLFDELLDPTFHFAVFVLVVNAMELLSKSIAFALGDLR